MNKQLKNKIRIKDIADVANVSIGTVDRVLHNRGEVAQETRNHILKIVNDLGYTPNILARSLSSKRTYKIGVLIPDYKSNNPYWEKPLAGIQQAASELRNYNFEISIYFFDLNSEQSFYNKSEDLFKIKPDGLMIAPVHYNATRKIVHQCDHDGIPYVFFDTDMDGCNNLAFFGQNSYMSGFLSARLMCYCLAETKEILILKPLTHFGTNKHLESRSKGFSAFLSSGANKKNIASHEVEIDVSSDKALKIGLDEVFKRFPRIGGIFVVNSRVHLIAQYLEQNNIQNLVLIGYDLLPDNIHFLDKDIVQFLIGQKPNEQGYKSVMALFEHLFLKKPVEKMHYSPVDIIMKDNIDYYRNI